MEDAILLQENVGFDPSQPKDDWIKDGEHGIADGISIVELLKAYALGENRSQLDALEKLLQKIQPAVMG